MEPSVRTVSAANQDENFELPSHLNDNVLVAAATIENIDDDDDYLQQAASVPANVEEDEVIGEDSDYSYEDDDEGYVSSFLQNTASSNEAAAAKTSATSTTTTPATIEDEPAAATKWREPTRQAVDMSLRAEKEKNGSKRRLAQDLYRIMNQDTQAAGFSLEPTNEDSMEQWTIKLFQFDQDSNLAKDMLVLGIDAIELNMSFPEHYPFEPPFVRVSCPRFKKQTGFVMNGALCMELLTKDGWNPVNDIESVIVSIRSLLVVGDGRIDAVSKMSASTYAKRLAKAQALQQDCVNVKANAKDTGDEDGNAGVMKRQRVNSLGDDDKKANDGTEDDDDLAAFATSAQAAGSYSATEAEQAYTHLSDYHQKKGWDSGGWWARKG
ncbi:hypothetical protein MPSEU_000596000 [Mayamaea pseudoterrestris]|nr:hypothetical protein MPSEU_000596000 [Mayamaea pseudoterrestris]